MVSTSYTLRAPEIADLEALVKIHCDPNTNKYRPGGAPSSAEAAAYLLGWLQHWGERDFGYWSIVDSVSLSVVGFGGVMLKEIGSRFGFNLYFRLAPEIWGKGVAQLVGKAALDESFAKQGAAEVFGLVRPANFPSRRALEKLGLKLSGQEDDVQGKEQRLIYSISSADYATRVA